MLWSQAKSLKHSMLMNLQNNSTIKCRKWSRPTVATRFYSNSVTTSLTSMLMVTSQTLTGWSNTSIRIMPITTKSDTRLQVSISMLLLRPIRHGQPNMMI
jgi:hypothetical protein